MKKISRREFVKGSMVAAGAVVLGGSFAGPFVGRSLAKDEIKVGYLKATHHAPFFVALEQGFYKQEGLDVKPVLFSGSGEIGSACVTGAIQVALLGAVEKNRFGRHRIWRHRFLTGLL